jgi:hypothetical protein
MWSLSHAGEERDLRPHQWGSMSEVMMMSFTSLTCRSIYATPPRHGVTGNADACIEKRKT